jgi:transcriptional regulator with GAF, ATPase, and Fis domain
VHTHLVARDRDSVIDCHNLILTASDCEANAAAGAPSLDEELVRAAASGGELALVIATASGAARAELDRRARNGAVRVDEAAIALVLPGLDEQAALSRARELVRGSQLAAGVAVAPFDGTSGRSLIAAARAAAARAGAGSASRAADAVIRLDLGAHVAIVADPAMERLYTLARRLARSAMPVSIHGETGTGKELVAAALHAFSPRAAGPFVALNCAAIPEGVAEAELFGHVRGAFTGASASRAGHIEAASGGTLFLDEVAELSPAMQARLLRVLDSGELRRLGENVTRQVDLRVVCASLKELRAEVDAGRFRKDLYYRLGSSARIEVPPLRERPRDVAALVRAFVDAASARASRGAVRVAPAVARALFAHSWPGNVRELRHVIDYAVAAAPEGATELLPCHLPPRVLARGARPAARAAPAPAPVPPPSDAAPRSVAEEVQALERRRMVEALSAASGVQIKAAELIGMPPRTFATKFKRYAIRASEWHRRELELLPR